MAMLLKEAQATIHTMHNLGTLSHGPLPMLLGCFVEGHSYLTSEKKLNIFSERSFNTPCYKVSFRFILSAAHCFDNIEKFVYA